MNLPELNTNTLTTLLLLYTALCCLLPMIVLGVGAYIAYQRGSSFLNEVILPDTDQMHAGYDALRAKFPDKTADELVQTIIQRQSIRCGAIGAITSIGGLPTLPITLPIDMIASYRIQAGMVNFIARAYEQDTVLPKQEEMVASLVMFGSGQVTDSATAAATKALTSIATDVGSKFISKLVPFVGAVIGFGVNYATTQATGQLAASVYSGQVVRAGGAAARLVRGGKPPGDDTGQDGSGQDDEPPPPPTLPA